MNMAASVNDRRDRRTGGDISPDDIREIKDRARRIETRLTRFLELNDFDTQTKRPSWVGEGRIEIPSPDCSIKSCLETIPIDWKEEVEVWCKGDFVAFLDPDQGV